MLLALPVSLYLTVGYSLFFLCISWFDWTTECHTHWEKTKQNKKQTSFDAKRGKNPCSNCDSIPNKEYLGS